MSAAEFNRAPYHVRFGTKATVEDRDGDTVLLVIEPLHDAAARHRRAVAVARLLNIQAAAAEPPALLDAAE